MDKWMMCGVLLLAAMVQSSSGVGRPMPDAQPNIVIIMSDDVGYSDVGCYGGEIPTPNIDRLAEGGVRFTQFYNTGRCCPSRAALLTGLYPHQAGIGHMLEASAHAGYQDTLSTDCVTMAEALKDSGYRTYMTGKWHLGRKALPLDRGFERFYGTAEGAKNYFDAAYLMRDRASITASTDAEYKPANYYYTDAVTDHAVRYLADHEKQSSGQPFLLYVAYYAAHWPLQAPADEIAKHKGRYDAGYDAVRQARIEKMKNLGLINADFTPAPTVGNWSAVPDKAREANLMETYAAMMTRMDTGIGAIMDTLKEQGKLDNTIVLYMQDNGACAEQPRAGKAQPDLRRAYKKEWANVSNTPLRKYKSSVHEGGIATPLIVHWPAGTAPQLANKLVHEPGHLIDVMATALDAAGTTYPSQYKNNAMAPLAGRSLLPLLQGEKFARQQPLFWEHQRNCAVRDGDWKLVRQANHPWELYNLRTDRGEMTNLADINPQRVKQLSAAWKQWAKENDVLPLGGWRVKPTSGKAGRK